MKVGYYTALLTCAVVAWNSSALCQLPQAQLTSVFPPGGKQGTSVAVTLAGTDLDEVDSLVFSCAGIVAQPLLTTATNLEPARPIPSQFQVTIDEHVAPGSYEVRAFGRFGLSNPRCFVVGRWEEKIDAGNNTSPQSACELPIDATLNGRIEPTTFDYVRLSLRKNEPVLLEVAARRIDSRLDSTLTILDPNGRELQRIKQGAGADPVTCFLPPADGAYLLKLSDEVYGGGSDYFYRLSASAAPFVDFVFPPSGVPGTTANYTIYGRNLAGGQPATGFAAAGLQLQKLTATISLPARDATASISALPGSWPLIRCWQDGVEYHLPAPNAAANPVSISYANAPNVIVEQEPNDDAPQAQEITLPCEVVGQFYPQRDFDYFQFAAKKGDIWWIEAISSQLGLPCDPALVLYRVVPGTSGPDRLVEVSQVDDLPERARRNPAQEDFDVTNDDPTFKFSVPEDGTYRLLIRDQFGDGRQDPSCVYRLVIRKAEPDFRILAYPLAPPPTQQMQGQTPLAAASIRRGGATAFNIVVQRRHEFEGELQLRVEGLPPGITSPGAVLAGEVATGSLVLVAAEDAPAFAGPIKIIGRGTVGGKEIEREARYAVVVWGTANRQQQPAEVRLAPSMQLGVIAQEADAALVRIGEDKIYETSLGGSLDLPIQVTRRGDFKDPIKLVAIGLTQQMRPKDVTLAADATTGKFELSLNQQNIRPGSYTFFLKGESKRKYVRNPEAVAAAKAEQQRVEAELASLRDKLKSATAAKDNLALDSLQARLKAANEQKGRCEKRLEEVTKASQPKDTSIALISTPVKLRIHASPIRLAVSAPAGLSPGRKAMVEVKIERLFGFADQVELTFEPASEALGVSAEKSLLKSGQSAAQLALVATKALSPGTLLGTVRAKGRFSNVPVEATSSLSLNAESQ